MKSFRFCLYIAISFSISCTGWNSELDTAYIEDGKSLQKPRCQFKLKENCWVRSINLLMECVQPETATPEVLTDDLRFCSNDTGKLVEFVNPLKLMGDFKKENIRFNVYDGSKKCFRFTGTQSQFKIDHSDYGFLEVAVLENGDTQVSCFFGESFVVPAAVKEQGCRNEKALVSEFLPQSSLKVETKKITTSKSREDIIDSFLFNFSGLGLARPIFNCQVPPEN